MPASAKCVPTELAHLFWPDHKNNLRAAMRRGDLGKFEELQRQVLDGEALLWVGPNSAAVTQVGIVESGKVCTIVACGGDGVLRALEMIEDIERYATEMGCRAMRVMGRKGWARALKGYRTTAVVLERTL